MFGFRFWEAELTQAQIQAEKDSYRVVRTADLYCELPFISSDFEIDKSGNGNDWTIGGTPTFVGGDDPLSLPATGAGRRREQDHDQGLSSKMAKSKRPKSAE